MGSHSDIPKNSPRGTKYAISKRRTKQPSPTPRQAHRPKRRTPRPPERYIRTPKDHRSFPARDQRPLPPEPISRPAARELLPPPSIFDPEQINIDDDGLKISFDDGQTREILMNLLWTRLQERLEQSSGLKKELYPQFFEIIQDLLDELTIEFREHELHINVSFSPWNM